MVDSYQPSELPDGKLKKIKNSTFKSNCVKQAGWNALQQNTVTKMNDLTGNNKKKKKIRLI